MGVGEPRIPRSQPLTGGPVVSRPGSAGLLDFAIGKRRRSYRKAAGTNADHERGESA